jgi:hypothetical protein
MPVHNEPWRERSRSVATESRRRRWGRREVARAAYSVGIDPYLYPEVDNEQASASSSPGATQSAFRAHEVTEDLPGRTSCLIGTSRGPGRRSRCGARPVRAACIGSAGRSEPSGAVQSRRSADGAKPGPEQQRYRWHLRRRELLRGPGGRATLVATPQGAYIVPEFGIGFGPSVSVNAGSQPLPLLIEHEPRPALAI